MNFNREKFKSMVHLICQRNQGSSAMGSVKLNKILLYSDFFWYYLHGESITGAKYIKEKRGPVPEKIVEVLNELKSEGKIDFYDVDETFFVRKHFVSKELPDLDVFSSEELTMIESTMNFIIGDHTAKSISNDGHDIVWSAAKMREEIPYDTVFVSELGEITDNDRSRALELVADELRSLELVSV